jgi:hypothetical protein
MDKIPRIIIGSMGTAILAAVTMSPTLSSSHGLESSLVSAWLLASSGMIWMALVLDNEK